MKKRLLGIFMQDRQALDGGRWWFLYATDHYVARKKRRKVDREKREKAAHVLEAMRTQDLPW